MRISLPTLSSPGPARGSRAGSLLAPLLLVAAGLLLPACAPPDGDPEAADRGAASAPAPEGASEVQPPGGEEGSPPAAGSDASHRAAAGPRVLFLGTSLTEGLGLEDPMGEAWPAQVEALAREAGVPMEARNAGLSGETSAGALRRLDWILQGPDPAPLEVFVLETGANDGLRGLPVQELEANLDSILARVRRAAPDAALVLAGMEAPPNLGAGYTESFRDVFPRVAARWNAHLVPFLLEGVAGEAALNQADGIHPTVPGHRKMAEVAWPVIRAALRGASPS